MQTVLLIFIVFFALGIGFFLGLFLLSLDTPLTKKLTKKDSTGEPDRPGAEPSLSEPAPELSTPIEKTQKPSPTSRLLLRIWKDEGKPPVYELDGTYLNKEDLPQEILNVITVHAEAPPVTATPTPPIKEKIPPIVENEDDGDSDIKTLSVVDEVNEILQRNLKGSAIAGKGIHLMENHNKEIRFWVGLNSYDDVDDIPDPEVRQIIDDAVKEWERSRA
ncbi:MAG: hypothetical protein V3R33_01420 [Anaerolineales bacterium]